jgi:cbb3-type cytochrome c oxidase subunit III
MKKQLSPATFEAVLMLVILAVAGVTGLIGWFVGHEMGIASGGRNGATSSRAVATTTATTTQPVSERVAAGGHDFVQFACAQCHGEQGQGGVSPDVPALTGAGQELTIAQLEQIINHGLGESANPTKPYMPVWGEVISKQQVSDLVAYIRAGLPAVAGAEAPFVPTDQGAPVAGAALYGKYGCINCHGPNGLGGVPNPQSPDEAIPPLSGADFFSEFNTDAKIKEIIRTGSVLGSAPIVSMPHWGGILSDDQLDELVAYIKTLKTD